MAKRNAVEIQVFLKRKNIKQVDIAAQAGVHPASVTRTINSERNNPKVLGALKTAGVPATLLG